MTLRRTKPTKRTEFHIQERERNGRYRDAWTYSAKNPALIELGSLKRIYPECAFRLVKRTVTISVAEILVG